VNSIGLSLPRGLDLPVQGSVAKAAVVKDDGLERLVNGFTRAVPRTFTEPPGGPLLESQDPNGKETSTG
jgi:hypothetical protein